ncbi:MAG: DUF6159 family protein [Limisphaerales bacterium]
MNDRENKPGRFRRSWLLFKSSVRVIRENPKLLVFPIVIAACTLVITLFFIAPIALRPTGHSYFEAEHWQSIGDSLATAVAPTDHSESDGVGLTPAALAYLALLYFVSMFVATYFNVAFYNEILAALGGHPVSIGRGLRFAATRWKGVLVWSLFAGVVGLIIKAIEEKLDLVGRLVARVIGLAWSVTSIFAIPVLVREETSVNPMAMLRASARMLKRTWGEALIGYAGLTFGNLLIALASVLLLGGAVTLSIMVGNAWIIGVVAAVWLVGLIAWMYLASVAGHVYKCALFLFAADGVVAAPYDAAMLQSAWKFKKK